MPEQYAIGYKFGHTWEPDPVEHAVPMDSHLTNARSLCGVTELTVVEEQWGERIPFTGGCMRCEKIIAKKEKNDA